MINPANPKYAPTGNNVWLVGADTGRLSEILSIERACGHHYHVHTPFTARVAVPVFYPCHLCMVIEP